MYLLLLWKLFLDNEQQKKFANELDKNKLREDSELLSAQTPSHFVEANSAAFPSFLWLGLSLSFH